ncbi:CIR protein PIR protein [Plasmodium vinckei vinckei]|uniref:CIR protein PIR protein n=1 Tax=Plasmodium vinckei vinckei TaxID=54757 RepID=A0A449BUH0_PLAVN|nr:CIR protein PIR protein [Plasmodium vinckei vinckei]VEV57117.1 CIR protein PIR protein [Plasmodium vinckei vinckei]
MDPKKMCELFREADSYFNGKDVDTTKISEHKTIKGYCNNGGCKTNEDGINAVAKYIIIKFKSSIKKDDEYNHYDEYLLMWISDKLLKIHKKGKGKNIGKGRMDAFTLKQAYGEYLEKHKKGLDYWGLLDMNQGLKEANLKYMSEFYKLLNIICKMITDYNNGSRKKIPKYSTDCGRQYKTLYINISECKSYLDLLNKLKGVYDDFSSNIKKNRSNNKLATNLKKLTPEDGDELEAVRGFKSYDFNRPKCKFPIKKKTTPPKASKLNPGPALNTKIQRESPGSQGVSNSTGGQLSNQGDTSKNSDSDQHKTTNETGKQGGGIVHKPEQSPDGQQQNLESKQGNSSSGPEISDDLKDIDQKPPTNELEKQPLVSETKEPSPPETSQKTQLQTQSDPVQPESQNVHESKTPQKEGSSHPNGQGVSKNDPKVSGSENGNPDDEGHEPGAPSDGTGDPPSGNHVPSQGGKQDITNPLDKIGTPTAGGSIDLKSSFFELILKGNEYYNKASDFIDQNQQKFKDAGKKISGAYNSAVDILKSAYNASSIYFNDMINSITNQINQYDTPKSRKSGDKLPQSNDNSQKSEDPSQIPPKEQTQITSPDPSQDPSSKSTPISSQPNQLPPQTQDGQSKDNRLQESPPTQNIDSPNSKQVNPSDSGDNQSESGGTGDNPPTPNGSPTPQKHTSQTPSGTPHISSPSPDPKEQTTPFQSSQGTSGNQNSDRTNQEGPKKPVTSPVVKKENIGTELKGNVITEIGGEYVLKKYKKIGLSIIVILIPITLTILHKYLSSGWRKELKKKTNMKKVINSIGGKKQIQIIIKSSNQKKNTKKSINSVYGEKSPSLNIYKIMQADPVPFINLFFLLIFFVYKRKRDFIEL